MRAFAALATLLFVLPSIGCQRPDVQPAPPPAVALKVEVTGCSSVAHGTRCELPAGAPLSLWVEAPTGTELTLSVESGEGRVTQSTVRVAQGGRIPLQPPADTRALWLGRTAGVPRAAAPFVLELTAPAALPVLDELKALRQQGSSDEAMALARSRMPALDAEARARVLSQLARLALAAGRSEEAETAFTDASQQHLALGRLSDAADDAFARSFSQVRSLRLLAQARAALEEAEPWAQVTPEGRARMAYYRGLLDVATGDVRVGLERMRSSVAQSERFELQLLARNGRQVIASLMLGLARYEDAIAELELAQKLETPGVSACERASPFINLAWASLLAREAGVQEGRAPGPLLDEAQAALDAGCADPHRHANVQLNRALDGLQRGVAAEVRRALLEADRYPHVRRGVLGLWREELWGRRALLEGKPGEALQSFERMDRLARSQASLPMAWRAELGAGRALEHQGKLEQALSRYEHAEQLLDVLRLDIPLSEGRDSFLGDRLASARRKVFVLWRLGRKEAALAGARRARARALSSFALAGRLERLEPARRRAWDEALSRYHQLRTKLEQDAAEDWKLPRERLPAVLLSRDQQALAARKALDDAFLQLGDVQGFQPRALEPSTLLLVYFPVEEGWLGFARSSTGLTARLLPLPSPLPTDGAALSEALLQPFSEALAEAGRIRVISSDEVAEVDFHALPWRGAPLVAHAPVEYSLDLGAAASPDAASGRALVVADARGDLPLARVEAASVDRALASSHDVSLLTGPQATREQVLLELRKADVFHYAGHGVHKGRGGWDSALRLAGKGALTVSDILALERAPRQVILSGCETGRSADAQAVSGLGLARAFVLSGAQSVTAASRTVSDSLAQTVGIRLHARPSGDAAVALQQTQLEWMKAGAEGDWSAFRVTVP